MKSERGELPLTIARLVRDATPVAPLAAPRIRLAGWAIGSTALALLAVIILACRPDVATQMLDGWFVARAAVTLGIVAGAAFVALYDVAPGLHASLWIRALPLLAAVAWAAMLVGTIAEAPSPHATLVQVAPHPSCVLLLVAIAIAPGAALLLMLRHAAPLHAQRTGGLAGLASAALGALGAQFVCANDAAATTCCGTSPLSCCWRWQASRLARPCLAGGRCDHRKVRRPCQAACAGACSCDRAGVRPPPRRLQIRAWHRRPEPGN